VSRFDLEAHDLLDAHGLVDDERQVLAVLEVSADRARDRLVVLEREVEVLALLEVLVEERELAVGRDVDELELGLGDDRARHRVGGGADELVLLARDEDVLADERALGAAVLAVLERVDLDDLAGAAADADEVALLEVAGRDGVGVGRVGVGTLEVLVVEVEVFLVAIGCHYILMIFFGKGKKVEGCCVLMRTHFFVSLI
jgi:hypothetical protein